MSLAFDRNSELIEVSFPSFGINNFPDVFAVHADCHFYLWQAGGRPRSQSMVLELISGLPK
jgi:hypothetical protein